MAYDGRICFNIDLQNVAEILPSNKKEIETPRGKKKKIGEQLEQALLKSRPLNG